MGGARIEKHMAEDKLVIDVVDNGGQWTHREWRMLRYLGVDTQIIENSTPIEEPKESARCNVFKLYKLLASDVQSDELKIKYANGNYGYGDAKQELFELICDKYKSERAKFNHLMQNKKTLDLELL